MRIAVFTTEVTESTEGKRRETENLVLAEPYGVPAFASANLSHPTNLNPQPLRFSSVLSVSSVVILDFLPPRHYSALVTRRTSSMLVKPRATFSQPS